MVVLEMMMKTERFRIAIASTSVMSPEFFVICIYYKIMKHLTF